MVHAASAVAFAVVALNAASTLAMSSYESADLMERDFDDFEIEARDFDFLDEFEARDLLDQFEERDFDDMGLDSREIQEVFEYLRDVTSTKAIASTSALPTVTQTKTWHPRATACSKSEAKAQDAARKAAKKAAKDAKKNAKVAKKLAKKQHHHDLLRLLRHHHHHSQNAKVAATTSASVSATSAPVSGSVSATSTSVSATATPTHHHHHHHKLARLAHIHPLHLHRHHKVAATPSVSANAKSAQITPAPQASNALEVSSSTHTKHGTVTIKVTTTAARPECTKRNILKKSYKATDGYFTRELEIDELD
ncbi:hypothetical protein GALMADRAFT_224056 [Galerina marginata CBS 339.88]|uniref:Uncharacterized protein n=1 Tax=Galerina marginata (strain CBS 339.88) TaxID=685588 RepID=A0A067T8X5_GALM3|nr:hypothetical protein GALMADRAFT_224056 [Galerina marginata CBS 339.88]